MNSARNRARRISLTAALTAVLGALSVAPSPAAAQFQLGLQDPAFLLSASDPATQAAYTTLQAVGGSTVRLTLNWPLVAPGGKSKPAGFRAADPTDPRYVWTFVDAAIRNAAQHHAQIVLTLAGAPEWAQRPGRPASMKNFPGPWDPSAAEFAQLAHAAALRYSGHFPDPLSPGASLPRVRFWEIWNEENLPYALGAPDLVSEYRDLLNAGYSAIKAVNHDDVVVVGGLAPVSFISGLSISPLKFATDLMCLRRVGSAFLRSRSCRSRAHFDIFAAHPYTLAATPTKHAYRYDDVLIGDMDKINRVVRSADRLRTISPTIRHQIWVTEWSWFTNPPNKAVGDSAATAARYVAYSMYEMWRSGVSLVIWFLARDFPQTIKDSPFLIGGGGLYASSGSPKLMLRAFTFPLVAAVSRGRGFAWGRAPVSRSASIVLERAAGRRWARIAVATTGSDGVFSVVFRARGNARYRARVLHGATSLGYDSTPIPPKRTHLFYSG